MTFEERLKAFSSAAHGKSEETPVQSVSNETADSDSFEQRLSAFSSAARSGTQIGTVPYAPAGTQEIAARRTETPSVVPSMPTQADLDASIARYGTLSAPLQGLYETAQDAVKQGTWAANRQNAAARAALSYRTHANMDDDPLMALAYESALDNFRTGQAPAAQRVGEAQSAIGALSEAQQRAQAEQDYYKAMLENIYGEDPTVLANRAEASERAAKSYAMHAATEGDGKAAQFADMAADNAEAMKQRMTAGLDFEDRFIVDLRSQAYDIDQQINALQDQIGINTPADEVERIKQEISALEQQKQGIISDIRRRGAEYYADPWKLFVGAGMTGLSAGMAATAKGFDWLNRMGHYALLGMTPEEYDNADTATQRLVRRLEQENADWKNYTAQQTRTNPVASAGEQIISGVTQAVPYSIYAMLSAPVAGASALGTAGLGTASSAAGLTGAAKLGNTVRNAVMGMAEDPQYWITVLNEVGGSYEQAKADGAGELEANAYALLNSLLNAMVEIGGEGIQKLPAQLRSGSSSAVREWVKSMIDEGKEEVVQGILERGLQMVYGKHNPLLSDTDENAIFNPKTAKNEFGMGALVGGVLGAGQVAVTKMLPGQIKQLRADMDMEDAGAAILQYGPQYVEALVNEGLELGRGTQAMEIAEQLRAKLDAGKTLTAMDVGQQYFANQQAIADEEAMSAHVTDERDAAKIMQLPGRVAAVNAAVNTDPLLALAREMAEEQLGTAEARENAPVPVRAQQTAQTQQAAQPTLTPQTVTTSTGREARAQTAIPTQTAMDTSAQNAAQNAENRAVDAAAANEPVRAGGYTLEIAQKDGGYSVRVTEDASGKVSEYGPFDTAETAREVREQYRTMLSPAAGAAKKTPTATAVQTAETVTATQSAAVKAQTEAGRSASTVNVAKNPGLNLKDGAGSRVKLTSGEVRTLDALGKMLGVEIRFADTLESTDAKGNRSAANAQIQNGVITIALDAEDPLMTSVIHETVHRIREIAPDAYAALEKFVKGNMRSGAWAINTKIRQNEYAAEEIPEEIVADAFGRLLRDEDLAAKFAADDRTAWQKLGDALRDLLVKIRRFLTQNQQKLTKDQLLVYKDLEGQVEDMLKVYSQAMEKAGENANAATEGGEAKYSKKSKIDEDFNDDQRQDIIPVQQSHTSRGTSINTKKVPALYSKAIFKPGTVNIDIGAGVEDTPATAYLKDLGVDSMPFDPFNRSLETNKAVTDFLQSGNKADTATCSNVLNVIDNADARANIILQMAKAIKPDGTAYFTVYSNKENLEAGKAGEVKSKPDQWQEFREAKTYEPEIRKYFDDVQTKGGLIIARQPKTNLPKATWQIASTEYTDRAGNRPYEKDKAVRFSKTQENLTKSDRDYLSAVERGDMDTAQKMVDEAARAAGYDIKAYHGTGSKFTVFDKSKIGSVYGADEVGFFFTSKKEIAEWAASDASNKASDERIIDAFLKIENPLEITTKEDPNNYYDNHQSGVLQMLYDGNHDGIIIKGSGSTTYIILESKQAKSADPVTYDDAGNAIPLSERFNAENEDIRYSKKSAALTEMEREYLAANNNLVKQNRQLRKEVESLLDDVKDAKRQTTRTVIPAPRQSDVEAVARDIVKRYGSTVKGSEISGAVRTLAEQIFSGDTSYEAVQEQAVAIARDIVNNAEELRSTDEDSYRQLKAILKEPLKISERDAADVSPEWGAWRNANRGKVNVSINGAGVPVDTVYEQLSEAYPGYFPEDITHPADQLAQMVDVMNALTPVMENPFSYNMAEAIEYAANDLIASIADMRTQTATFADKAAKELAQAKAHGQELVERERERKNARIEEITHQNAERTKEALRRVREKRDNQISALKEHYKDQRVKAAERRAESEARTRLLKIVKRLQNKKLPAVSRALLQQYIGDIDSVSKGLTAKSVEKLSDLRDWYMDRKENDPDFISDPAIEKSLERLSKRQISDLTIDEVIDLTRTLLNIENEIRTERKLIDSADRRDTYLQGLDVIRDIEEAKGSQTSGLGSVIDKYITTETLSPVRLVKRMVGWAKNDPLLRLTNDLADGQRKMMDYQLRAGEKFQRFLDDKKLTKRIAGKDAEEIRITGIGKNGPETLTITPAMRMSLYLHSRNDQNLRHVAGGGVTIPDMKLYKAGKIEEAYKRGRTIKLTPSEVRKITSRMTTQEKAFADAAHAYFNGMSQKEINEASEKLKGYSLAEVANYFPINTDTSFTRSDFDSLKFDGTIEGMGFLKERINAANPIMLRDMNDVLTQSIDQTAKYVGLAIPVRNFNKVWGVTKSSFNKDGTRNGFESSVQQAVGQKWGSASYNYIEKMMTDLQNSGGRKEVYDKLFNKIRSNYAAAVLTLNLSVALKQAASYPTAGAVIGFRPLARALLDVGKVNLDLINKYTPLQWYRSQGFSNQELGDMARRGKKLPKALNWVQGMDLLTTRKLWKASEYYVRQNFKNLNVGSDAYYRQVADVYNQVIEETQPNYTTMQRPQLLRSDSTLLQNLAMFKTQPFQNFNILYDAYGNLGAARRAVTNSTQETRAEAQREYKEAAKRARWATVSQIVQLAVFAGMTFAWNAFRGKLDKYKDDDDEMTLGSILKGIGKDMIGGAASIVPFGSDVWELASAIALGEKYYGMDAATPSAISDMLTQAVSVLNGMKDVYDTITDPDKVLDWNSQRLKLDKLLKTTSKVLGVPYENIENLFNSTFRLAAISAGGKYEGTYAYLKLTSDPSKNSQEFYDNLYAAYSNDPKSYTAIYDAMIDSGDFSQDKIKSAMETRMKAAQGVKKVEDLDMRWVTPNKQREYERDVEKMQHWELWKSATDKQQDAVMDLLYGLAMDSSAQDVKAAKEKIKGGKDVGLDEMEYLQYFLSMKVNDTPNSSGKLGTYTAAEYEAAIRDVPGLSDAERSYLWTSAGNSEKTDPWRWSK